MLYKSNVSAAMGIFGTIGSFRALASHVLSTLSPLPINKVAMNVTVSKDFTKLMEFVSLFQTALLTLLLMLSLKSAFALWKVNL